MFVCSLCNNRRNDVQLSNREVKVVGFQITDYLPADETIKQRGYIGVNRGEKLYATEEEAEVAFNKIAMPVQDHLGVYPVVETKEVCVYCVNGAIGRAVTVLGVPTESGKAFNTRFMVGQGEDQDAVEVIRTPWKGRDIEGNKTTVFNADLQFKSHEGSWLLNRLVGNYTWGDYITDSPERLKEVLVNGWTTPEGEHYVCVFANWRDRGGKAILVHEAAGMDNLAAMGVNTKLKSIKESTKACKYINRIFAPTSESHIPVWGKLQDGSWIEETREGVIELSNGTELIIKYVDLDDLDDEETSDCDGHIGLSVKAHRALGLNPNPKIGDSYAATVLVPKHETGKGHTRFQPTMAADIVIYGGKRHVNLNDDFCFSILRELHETVPHTDELSVTNFKLGKLCETLAENFMRKMFREANSRKGMLKLLANTLRPTAEELENIEGYDATEYGSNNKWLLQRMLRMQIHPFAFPNTYMRAVRSQIEKTMRVGEFYIPMSEVAIGKYISGDPFAVREDGTPDMKLSRIPVGKMVCMDLPAGTIVVMYRQPNENSNAWVLLEVIHDDAYADSKGKGVVFLGNGAAKVRSRMGGADNDDRVNIVFNPEWVAHFQTLSYPETDKLSAVDSSRMDDLYDDMGEEQLHEEPSELTIRHMEYQINVANSQDLTGIGPAVNVGMIDSVLSDPEQKKVMQSYMEFKGIHPSFIEALLNREDYTSAFLTTNQEIIIDASVKDPVLLEALNEEARRRDENVRNLNEWIREFHKAQRVYPVCMEKRIPQRIKDNANFVLVYSDQCRSQARIQARHDQMMNQFVLFSHKLVRKASPVIINARPANEVVVRAVNEKLRPMWRELLAGVADALNGSQKTRREAYASITSQLDAKLSTFKPSVLQAMAVVLYGQMYRDNKSKVVPDAITGNVRSYSDGLLWTSALGNAFLDVIQDLGMAGSCFPVDLKVERHLAQDGKVRVYVDNGMVKKLEGQVFLGTVSSALPRGNYTMSFGYIFSGQASNEVSPLPHVVEALDKMDVAVLNSL